MFIIRRIFFESCAYRFYSSISSFLVVYYAASSIFALFLAFPFFYILLFFNSEASVKGLFAVPLYIFLSCVLVSLQRNLFKHRQPIHERQGNSVLMAGRTSEAEVGSQGRRRGEGGGGEKGWAWEVRVAGEGEVRSWAAREERVRAARGPCVGRDRVLGQDANFLKRFPVKSAPFNCVRTPRPEFIVMPPRRRQRSRGGLDRNKCGRE